MKKIMNPLKALLLVPLALLLAGNALQAADKLPQHVVAAEELLGQLDLANTNYEHGQGTVAWTAPAASHTDCSGFIDHLFMHCYGYNREAYKKWFGSFRPTAARYHDAIVEQTGFTRLQHLQDLRVGDLIAVKYLQRKDNTGHIMLAASLPVRQAAGKPVIPGTSQWTVTVIDSSESGHGPTDTRHKRGPEGKDHDGLGEGVLRIYTDNQGEVLGFSWSTTPHSEFKSPDSENLVLGRLIPGYQP